MELRNRELVGFFHVFLLLIILFKFSLQQCTYEKDGCEPLVRCIGFADNVDPNYNPYSAQFCKNSFISLSNGGSCRKINLRYTEVNHDQSVPTLVNEYDNYITNCFKSLDLSNDNHLVVPTFEIMSELKLLNLSFNAITIAKLSSAELPKLSVIDYSHNMIDQLQIDDEEYVFRNLISLNMSHNKLAEIKDAPFDRLVNMQYLDLSNNIISHINTFSFEGMKKLVYLNLAYNYIDDINGSLFRFSGLKRLILNNNKISKVSLKDIEQLSKLEEVDLSYNAIFDIESNVFNALPLLRIIKLNNNELVNLDKQMFLNTSDLYSIDLSYNKISALPRLLFDGKNITNFNIEYNNLEGALINGTFKGLTSVLKLDMSYQNITSIEDFAFTGIDKLVNLILNNNKIGFVSSTSFYNLHDLKYLDLSYNLISDIDGRFSELKFLENLALKKNFIRIIKKDDFVALKELETLDISHNNITIVEPNSFENLNNLLTFDITGCQLSNVLKTNTFKGMNLLPILDISYTSLTAIQNSSFNQMFRLESLNISHGAIEEISFNAFLNTSYINTLDLSHNLIKSINLNTSDLMNLRYLYLNHNLLTVISSNFFTDLLFINTINLASNNINNMSVDTFSKCKELMVLDLSFNKKIHLNYTGLVILPNLRELFLSGIADNIFFSHIAINSPLANVQMSHSNITNVTSVGIYHLPNINSISLNNNKIKSLEIGAFSNLMRLTSLDLSFNEIHYIQPGVFKDNSNLNILNISHNQITALNYGVFRGLSYMETLDLSYNEIQDLESERFYDVQNLRQLIVDYNKITKIGFDDHGSVYFSMLSLGGNPIPCEMLVKLKRNKGSMITAIKLDESSQENIDGVTCYGKAAIKHTSYTNNSVDSNNILSDIRDILVHLSAKKAHEEASNTIKSDNNFNEHFQKLIDEQHTNVAISEKNANVTNSLLERILKVIVAYNSRVTSTQLPITKDNATFENILPYLQKVKQEMENSLAIEKETILSDVSDRIALINKKLEESLAGQPTVINSENNTYKSNPFLFLDVCVGLMLFIVMCFVIYKMYECVMYSSRRRTYSTQRISHAMDNSNL